MFRVDEPLVFFVVLLADVDAMLAGVNVADKPVGRPLAVSATAELKLLAPVTVTVDVQLVPSAIVSAVALSASVKLGAPVTVRLTEVVLVIAVLEPLGLPVPVTVSV